MRVHIDAKELSEYILERYGKSVDFNIKTTNERLLDDMLWKYRKPELKAVIDYIYDVLKKPFYSVRFFQDNVPGYLEAIAKQENSKIIKQQIEEETQAFSLEKRNEEVKHDESTKRNQNKSKRFGVTRNWDSLFEDKK